MTTSNKDLISRTLATRMMACIEEYEAIKRKESKLFKTVKQFCEFNRFSHQNFMKIYHRYKQNPCEYNLLPQKRGPKYQIRRTDLKVEKLIVELRKQGNSRYEIKEILKQKKQLIFFGCPLSMWGLSSLTRNGNSTLCTGSAES